MPNEAGLGLAAGADGDASLGRAAVGALALNVLDDVHAWDEGQRRWGLEVKSIAYPQRPRRRRRGDRRAREWVQW